MFNFIRNLIKKRSERLISAAEISKDRPVYTSNIPGPYLTYGMRKGYLEFNNSEYQEKLLRKRSGNMNYLDIDESEIEDKIRTIMTDVYNYQYKLIPVIESNYKGYKDILYKLNSTLNKFHEDHYEVQLHFTAEKYKKHLPSGVSMIDGGHLEDIRQLIKVLEEKEQDLKEMSQFEIYKDSYDKLRDLNRFLVFTDSRAEERMKFYNIS